MESSAVETPLQQEIGTRSVIKAFRDTAQRVGDRTAIRTKGDAVSVSYADLKRRVDELAGGLVSLGLNRGDTVALLFGNRPEFHVADLAAMTVGATPFSIYTTASPEQIEYVISDAGARIALCEESLAPALLKARESLPDLEHVVACGEAPEGCLSFDDVCSRASSDFDPDASAEAVERDDVLTLIYTSGTTGPPKGVELTHDNLLNAVESFRQMIEFPEGFKVISWLPNAHIAERAAHHYIPLTLGGTITCCEDPRQIAAFLPEVNPTWFFAVPRIWEKMKAGLEAKLAASPDDAREKAQGALDAAIQKIRLEQKGETVPDELAQAVAKADEEMFVHLRRALGLDEAKAVNVGAAPTPVEVLEFFHAIGIPVAELWGMSETCGSGTVNPPDKIKIGTVGPPAPGNEIKLAEDGEVLIRGGMIMRGYRNQPEKTSETIDSDGWLHTGDIGEIDDDGYLKIVDRKKELIINAAGKNMSPANIEATLKSSSDLIGQCAVIGDARKYNTALIVLDADYAPGWAEKQGISDTSLEALAQDEKVRAAVQEGVDAANERLARVEQIKKFHIVRGDWLPGGDELTPTMKLKRKPIAEKYSGDIEAMYEG